MVDRDNSDVSTGEGVTEEVNRSALSDLRRRSFVLGAFGATVGSTGVASGISSNPRFLDTASQNTNQQGWLVKISLNPYEKIWSRQYGDSGADGADAVAKSDDGFFIGGSTTVESGNQDFWVLETDSDGKKVSSHTYGEIADDRGRSITATADGGFAIAGHFGSGDGRHAAVVKADPQGSVEFITELEESGSVKEIVQTSDGGYALATGQFVAGAFGDERFVKLDSDGNIEISRTNFAGQGDDDDFTCLVQTKDGGYALGGGSGFNGPAWVLKLDSDGKVEFEQFFDDGDGDNVVTSITQTQDGGYAIVGEAGRQLGSGTHDEDSFAWFRKLDGDGQSIHLNTFSDNPERDRATSVMQSSDGGYAVVGYSGRWSGDEYDAWFRKLDSQGDEVFKREFGGSGIDQANSVIETSPNEFVFAGRTIGTSDSDGQLEEFVLRRQAKLDLAERIDDHSISDLDEREEVQAILDNPNSNVYDLTRAVEEGTISVDTGIEVIKRLILAENLTDETLAAVGDPSMQTVKNRDINITYDTSSIAIDTAIDLIFAAISLKFTKDESPDLSVTGSRINRLATEATKRVKESVLKILKWLLGDTNVESLRNDLEGFADAVFYDVIDGTLQTADSVSEALSEAVEPVIESIATSIQADIEVGGNTEINVLDSGSFSYETIEEGNGAASVYEVSIDEGHTTLHQQFDAGTVEDLGGPRGSLQGAQNAVNNGYGILQESAVDADESLNHFEAAASALSLIENVLNLIENVLEEDWVAVLQDIILIAFSTLAKFTTLFTNLSGALVGRFILDEIQKNHTITFEGIVKGQEVR